MSGHSLIPCLVCGEELSFITPTHLRKHDLTVEEYIKRFPDAPLMNEQVRNVRSETNKNRWRNPEFRERGKQILAMMSARRKFLGREATCVDCGKFYIRKSWKSVRCADCQRIRRNRLQRKIYAFHRDLLIGQFKELCGSEYLMIGRHPTDLRGRLGTIGTPQMNLGVLANSRIFATAWLEGDKNSLRLGAVEEPDAPRIPRRRQLPKMGWQTRLMERCLACGSHGIAVWQENPHCFDCGSELVLARENEYYSVREIACSMCGVIDNTSHYIFSCEKCGGEYRFRIGNDGQTEMR